MVTEKAQAKPGSPNANGDETLPKDESASEPEHKPGFQKLSEKKDKVFNERND